jgi:hypothetical protein
MIWTFVVFCLGMGCNWETIDLGAEFTTRLICEDSASEAMPGFNRYLPTITQGERVRKLVYVCVNEPPSPPVNDNVTP